MKIESLASIVAGPKIARDRRKAIRKSWSPAEMESRRREAVGAQRRLAALITMGQKESTRIDEVVELGVCSSHGLLTIDGPDGKPRPRAAFTLGYRC